MALLLFFIYAEKNTAQAKLKVYLRFFDEFLKVYFQFFWNFRKYTLKRVKNDFGKCFITTLAGLCKALSGLCKHSY